MHSARVPTRDDRGPSLRRKRTHGTVGPGSLCDDARPPNRFPDNTGSAVDELDLIPRVGDHETIGANAQPIALLPYSEQQLG